MHDTDIFVGVPFEEVLKWLAAFLTQKSELGFSSSIWKFNFSGRESTWGELVYFIRSPIANPNPDLKGNRIMKRGARWVFISPQRTFKLPADRTEVKPSVKYFAGISIAVENAVGLVSR